MFFIVVLLLKLIYCRFFKWLIILIIIRWGIGFRFVVSIFIRRLLILLN